MTARILRIAAMLIVSVVLLYMSRFWPFELWSRPGLFGMRSLPPGGDALRVWLRGTPYVTFAIPIWVIVGFLALSLTERLTAIKPPTEGE